MLFDKNNEKEKNAVIGIIIFVVVLVILSLFFTVIFTMEKDAPIIELPRVEFSVISEDGSTSTNVSAVFSIKTNDKTVQNMEEDIINADIIEAMKDIDYTSLSEGNGTEYVKAVVKEQLSRKYGDAIEDVYISDFINDVRIPSKEKQDNKDDSSVNKTMEGLFKNMN